MSWGFCSQTRLGKQSLVVTAARRGPGNKGRVPKKIQQRCQMEKMYWKWGKILQIGDMQMQILQSFQLRGRRNPQYPLTWHLPAPQFSVWHQSHTLFSTVPLLHFPQREPAAAPPWLLAPPHTAPARDHSHAWLLAGHEPGHFWTAEIERSKHWMDTY